MKSCESGKRENLKEAREAKGSEGKPRKVPTEEAAETKTPDDLELAIAEMVHNRQPYHVIAKKLKVSPRSISTVTKKMTEGTIKIGADGKAMRHTAGLLEIGPLPAQLQMEILGASHLENKPPQEMIAGLIRLDRRMRLEGLNMNQLERAAEFLEKAHSRGWTTDGLVDILTRLQNSGFSTMDQQLVGSLREFLEDAKTRNLKPGHIVEVSQKTESEWKKHTHEAYNNGLQDGMEKYESCFLELLMQRITDPDLLQLICRIAELAERVTKQAPRATSNHKRMRFFLLDS